MTVWAVSSTRDEADILERSTCHMLAHADVVLIEDHLSTDTTPEILERLAARYADRLQVTTDDTPTFRHDAKTARIAYAAAHGATWVVPFDTDEFWAAPQPLRELLPTVNADHVSAPVFEHVPIDAAGSWRHAEAWAWAKVAARAGIEIGIGHHEAGGRGTTPEGVAVHHFPWRSKTQARRRIKRGAVASETSEHAAMFTRLAAYLDDDTRLDRWWNARIAVPDLVYDPLDCWCG